VKNVRNNRPHVKNQTYTPSNLIALLFFTIFIHMWNVVGALRNSRYCYLFTL